MSLARHIETCHRHDLSRFRPFLVADALGDHRVGWVAGGFADILRDCPGGLEVERDCVRLPRGLPDYAARSAAMAEVVEWLFARGLIAEVRGEIFPVATSWDDPPLLEMDRGAAVRFGIAARKVQVNGFVAAQDAMEPAAIWIAQRSWQSLTAPGKFDTLVVGGQPIELSPLETLIKEGEEEAGLPETLARRAHYVRSVSYLMEAPEGLRNDRLAVYDLELPDDFAPDNQDGEIIGFRRLSATDLIAELAGDEFKFNTGLVLLDFLLRRAPRAIPAAEVAAILAAFERHHALRYDHAPSLLR
ncbi:MAG: DUF4743 domain-containing protein [Alphaproteobacteria bacterium]